MGMALKKKILTTAASLLFINACSAVPTSEHTNAQPPASENTATKLTPKNFSGNIINAQTGKEIPCPSIKKYITYVFNKYGEIDLNVVGITVQTLAKQCANLDAYKQRLEKQKKQQSNKNTFSI